MIFGFVDESGAIDLTRKTPFIVTIILMNEIDKDKLLAQHEKWERFIRKKYKEPKKTELKGTWFRNNEKKLNDLNKYVQNILDNDSFTIAYGFLEHKNFKRWSEKKDWTYNFMLKKTLEKIISENSKINFKGMKLLCDNRGLSKNKKENVQDYFVNKKWELPIPLDINKLEFADSKTELGLRLVDLLSFSIHGRLRKLNDIDLKKVIVREIW